MSKDLIDKLESELEYKRVQKVEQKEMKQEIR